MTLQHVPDMISGGNKIHCTAQAAVTHAVEKSCKIAQWGPNRHSQSAKAESKIKISAYEYINPLNQLIYTFNVLGGGGGGGQMGPSRQQVQ